MPNCSHALLGRSGGEGAMRTDIRGRVVLLVTQLGLLAGSGCTLSRPSARECTNNSECVGQSFCHQGLCVNDAPGGSTDAGTTPDPVVVPGEVCRSVGPDAPPAPRLVDIIFVIDNSVLMTEEIVSVQDNINAHFADLLDQSGVDYRVILVSEYGRAADERVCIQAPLGGSPTCEPPPIIPMNGERFFHYDQQITDRDALGRLYLIYDAPD